MRLASYNVENLFDRPRAMNLATWAEGKPILQDFAALSAVLGEVDYTPARKRRIAALMTRLGLDKSDAARYVILRQNRGALVKRSRSAGLEVVATGRADWAGSLELQDEPVDDVAMRNTARVIGELGADVLAVVEAESRPVLAAFNEQLLKAVGASPLRHVMLIDGNDERGIDVGLLTSAAYPIATMRSHVDDRDAQGRSVFSRDCPEYAIPVAGGKTLWVLVNHFKSKGFGSPATSNARRKAQAARVAEIYRGLVGGGENLIAVVGDLNDTPGSDPLAPLVKDTDLTDVFVLPAFDNGGWPGTYGLCSAGNKIDFILLSPALRDRATAGGVLRKGMWPGTKPRRWEPYAEIKEPRHAASDHAALWVDLDL